jgi:hypothetical protein
MNIDELHSLWDADSVINEDHLDRESIKSPQLHSKYLRYLIQHKMKFAALQAEYKTLRQKKFRYYRGEMPKPELEEYGWSQWQGIKPLKNEMDEFLEGDADLNKINIKCEYIKGMVEALEAILSQIKSRDWQIRNAIEFKKFVAGS